MSQFLQRFKNYKRQFDINRQVRQSVKIQCYNNQNNPFSPSDPIIVCGQPRGGTTWLAEVLATKTTGIIWEPLHPEIMKKYIHTKKINSELGNFPYLPENIHRNDLEDFLNNILTVKFLPYEYISWPKSVNKNLMSKREWIVKFCRANRILPWIANHINCKPPLYLLRHPCAVVSSQLRHEAFNHMGTKYLPDDGNYKDLYLKYEHILNKVNTRVEKLAAWWAMDNIIPLKHVDNNKKWITVTYEELVSEPEIGFNRIYKRLGMSMPEDLVSRLNKPSATTKPGSNVLTGGNQLYGWRDKLTKTQIKEILNVVNAFDINIYSENIHPDYDKLVK